MVANLVLSLFPGADLFGRGFEAAGYCVVRGPDPLWGQSIEDFTPLAGCFEGCIGGSPCQDFSKARRHAPSGLGRRMLREFARCVEMADPNFWILENVPGVPDLVVPNYIIARLNVRASEFGGRTHRLRTFQFGCHDGIFPVLKRPSEYENFRRKNPSTEMVPAAMASEGRRKQRRSWSDFCELQGLPRTFEIPGVTLRARYSLVGNGVFVPLARAVAFAIKSRQVTAGQRTCVCGCWRPVGGNSLHALASCRKRMERLRRVDARRERVRHDVAEQQGGVA